VSLAPARLRITEYRQRDAPADGHHAQQQADAERGQLRHALVHALAQQEQIEQSHHQRDAGVDFPAQHLWHPAAHNVPDDPAEDAGGDPRHDHHDGLIPQIQGDIAADDGEGDQTDGVENQEELVQVPHEPGDHDGGQAAGKGHVDIAGVLGPGDREIAQQDVADGTATQSGEKGDHGHPEQIHVAASGGQGAGHGFGDDGNEIDRGQHTVLLRYVASPPVLIPESLQSGSACPFGGLPEQPLSRRRWMVSAVPVPERLWEVAPSAGPAALSPADGGSIGMRGVDVDRHAKAAPPRQ